MSGALDPYYLDHTTSPMSRDCRVLGGPGRRLGFDGTPIQPAYVPPATLDHTALSGCPMGAALLLDVADTLAYCAAGERYESAWRQQAAADRKTLEKVVDHLRQAAQLLAPIAARDAECQRLDLAFVAGELSHPVLPVSVAMARALDGRSLGDLQDFVAELERRADDLARGLKGAPKNHRQYESWRYTAIRELARLWYHAHLCAGVPLPEPAQAKLCAFVAANPICGWHPSSKLLSAALPLLRPNDPLR